MHDFFLQYDSTCVYTECAKFHEKILGFRVDFEQNV